MSFQSTGKGLTFLLAARYMPQDGWMAFATWYSIKQLLPESNVVLYVERMLSAKPLFGWSYRLSIPIIHGTESDRMKCAKSILQKNKATLPLMVVDSSLMMIRSFDNKHLSLLRSGRNIINANGLLYLPEDDQATAFESNFLVAPAKSTGVDNSFVSYEECGKFLLKKWTDSFDEAPFGRTTEIAKGLELTPNERKILGLWRKMNRFYDWIK